MATPIRFRDLDPVELRGEREHPEADPTDDERIARRHPDAVRTEHFDFGPRFDSNPF